MTQNLIWWRADSYIILIIRPNKMIRYLNKTFWWLFSEKIFFLAPFFDFKAFFRYWKSKIAIKMRNWTKKLSVFKFLMNLKITDYRRKSRQILLACFVTMSGQKNKIVLTYIIPKRTYVQEWYLLKEVVNHC